MRSFVISLPRDGENRLRLGFASLVGLPVATFMLWLLFKAPAPAHLGDLCAQVLYGQLAGTFWVGLAVGLVWSLFTPRWIQTCLAFVCEHRFLTVLTWLLPVVATSAVLWLTD